MEKRVNFMGIPLLSFSHDTVHFGGKTIRERRKLLH